MPDGGRAAAGPAGHRVGLAAVLFDMDGLLVDSEPLWFEVECAIMSRLGGAWDRADQEALVGGSLERSMDYLLAKATAPATRAEVGEWLIDGMVELLATRPLPVMPGARELVTEIAEAGLPFALVTSSERPIKDAVLKRLAIDFPVTVCGDDVRSSKPDPEPYLLAATLLGVDPRRCVVLEDSPNGVASAEAAGCLTVAVPSLIQIPPAPGRVVVSSLAELSLGKLTALAGAR